MKNKIITKIVLVVVCLCTLLVTFVLPSFAYTVSNTSALYNEQGTFNIPGYNAINLKNVSSQTDIPDILSYPIADYYGSRETTVVGSFVSNIDNTPGVSWSAMKSVHTVNNYSTGYYQNGDVKVVSTATNFPFDYYEIDSIVLRDYRFNSPEDLSSTNSCSIELFLFEPELFSQTNANNGNVVQSLKVNYHYKYYDEDSEYHDEQFDAKVYGVDGGDGSTRFYIRYFPTSYYGELDPVFFRDYLVANPIYQKSERLIYLEELVITIEMEGYDINFMTDRQQATQAIQRSIGSYTNRLTPSNSGTPSDLLSFVYERGEEAGYRDGYSDAIEEADTNIFDSIIKSVNDFLDWEFIPNVSFSILLSIVIGASLLIVFLKIFAGG